MKTNKILGMLLLALTAGTIVGMVLNNDNYWAVYNYFTLVICGVSGLLLFKQ